MLILFRPYNNLFDKFKLAETDLLSVYHRYFDSNKHRSQNNYYTASHLSRINQNALLVNLNQSTNIYQTMQFQDLDPYVMLKQVWSPTLDSEDGCNLDQNYKPQRDEEQMSLEVDNDSNKSDHTQETIEFQQNKRIGKSSEMHNMFKQTVLTIKYINDGPIREIKTIDSLSDCIRDIWNTFMKIKSPSRGLLKNIFDENINLKKFQSYGFKSITSKYQQGQICNALREIKEEIIFRMKQSTIKAHLIGRKMAKKNELAAYIIYFIQNELKSGKMQKRFNYHATQNIKSLVQKNKNEENCIDKYLDLGSEEFDGFSSKRKQRQ